MLYVLGSLPALLALSWAGLQVVPLAPVHADAPRAVWLGHRWVADPIEPGELVLLAGRLRDAAVTDVYVHVGPLEPDGTIPFERTPRAQQFVLALHRRLPDVRIQAWIGQVEALGGGPLDLSRSDVRTEVVRTARRFLGLGFHGVHYDIEPIWDGDERFLALLKETAAMLDGRGAVLSVAAEELPMFPGARRILREIDERYHPWSKGYHRRVAEHADQVAVMAYDSALPLGHLYERFVARQARVLGRVLPDDTELLIGVPSYEEWNIGHWPAENVAAGLAGLRRGIARLPQDRRHRVGWALYAEYTTDAREWALLAHPEA